MAATIALMGTQLSTIGARSAWVSANRLNAALADSEAPLRFADVKRQIEDIESRFADHLTFVRFFVVREDQLPLLGTATDLLGDRTAPLFRSVWFDTEEAAKCICCLRPTAAVFHCMRILEVGIRAFAARLDIPDPVNAAERNWGVFLRKIRDRIDELYPLPKRVAGSEGAYLEALYATLDAVKNPWRNATMHVEGVYTDVQAWHVYYNSVTLIQKMSEDFDDSGQRVENPALLPMPDTN